MGPIALVISGTYYHQTYLPVNCAQLLNSLENEFLYVYKIHFTIKTTNEDLNCFQHFVPSVTV